MSQKGSQKYLKIKIQNCFFILIDSIVINILINLKIIWLIIIIKYFITPTWGYIWLHWT